MGLLDGLRKIMNPDIFNPPMGNDLPSQGGFGGQLPINMSMRGLNLPDLLTPVSQDDPDGGTLPQGPNLQSNNPATALQPQMAPDVAGRTVGDVPVVDESPDDFIRRRMGELYTPEHTASDAFNQLISEFPQRGKPGFMKKLAASLYGMGHGPEEADKILYNDYYRQLNDWKTKVGPEQQAANLERYANSNERQYANQEVQRELQERDIKRKEDKDKATGDYQQKSVEARNARTAFMYYKQNHPNHVYKADGDGYVYSIDPQTNGVQYIQDENGDLIASDKLPEAMRLQKQHENKMGEIDETGKNRIEAVQEAGVQQRQTNAAKPATGSANKPPSARELAQRRKNRIADVIAADPNNSKYIKTDPNTGAIMLQAPGGMMTSPTPEQLEHVKQLRDYIFNDIDTPATSHGPSGGQNTLPPPQQRVVGRQYIMGNGKPGIWTGKGFTAVTGQ